MPHNQVVEGDAPRVMRRTTGRSPRLLGKTILHSNKIEDHQARVLGNLTLVTKVAEDRIRLDADYCFLRMAK
jgi:hypothetical protein